MQIQPIAATASALPASRRSDATGQAAATPATLHLLNPKPAIDPGLGIIVTEYFNKAGDLTEQYPTARALDTYRIYGLPKAGSPGGADGANTAATGGTPGTDRTM